MVDQLRTELNSEFVEVFEKQEELGIPTSSQVTPESGQRLLADAWEDAGVMEDPLPVGNVRQYSIPGPNGSVPIRIYTPKGDGLFPVVMWMHGGGWVRGDLDTADTTSRMIVRRSRCTVVSVDYRLAPEHPFPAGLRDCYATLNWIDENQGVVLGNGEDLIVGGTSAGGNFAAALALMSRDLNGPEIKFHICDNPVMDYSFDRLSYQENKEGFGLDKSDMRNYWEHYLEDEIQGYHPYASPLRTRDLSDLPPALVTTAGFDVLRDEGIVYANRLKDVGVRAIHRHYPDIPHAAIASSRLSQRFERSLEVIDDLCNVLCSEFGR